MTDQLRQLIVCPVCKGKLEFSTDLIMCSSCDLRFTQPSADYIDLLPLHLLKNTRKKWVERQQEMEGWYKDLVAKAAANDCFVHDYTPLAPYFASLSGNILDVGGGVGIVRSYLPDGTQYTVIDPSLDWLEPEWASLAGDFPALGTKLRFVRGFGEWLPFSAQTFDVVLALWSLNHASDPGMVFNEVWRVLRPGGRFFVVLEDMAPSWGDIANGTFPASKVGPGGGDPSREHPAPPSGQEWPLQGDHIRIRESDIHAWISQQFEITRREWVGQYLAFEFGKSEPLVGPKSTKEVRRDNRRIGLLENERHDFVCRLQELESALSKERQSRPLQYIRSSRAWRLLMKLRRIPSKVQEKFLGG